MAEDQDDENVLDFTGSQLKSLEGIDLHPQLTELDLTTNRLSNVDPRIGSLTCLQRLSLRQNLLKDDAVSVFPTFTALQGLRELVLHDNQLTKVPPLGLFSLLTILDVSFNHVHSLEGAELLTPTLEQFFSATNQIVRIECIGHLSNLRVLELGSNKIRVMENLEGLTALQELWLGRNKIREVDLCGLTQLVRISLQSNRLTSTRGFEACVSLVELYLSHNGITKMEGLSTLVNLRVLDMSNNRIEKIAGLDMLTRLEDLWLNDNSVSSLENVGQALAGPKASLTTLYLERNPVASEPQYILKLRGMLPHLQQIDAVCF